MLARILFPRNKNYGNLLWRKEELQGNEADLSLSLQGLRKLGYWASAYPEGDGVTFATKNKQDQEQIMNDFVQSFSWLTIEKGNLTDSNLVLAELEDMANEKTDVECIVIVPLERVHFEATFEIGPFKFVCAEVFQSLGDERLADFAGAYIQFNTKLEYADLLRGGASIKGDDLIINKCLSIAEHVMDVIRLEYSSFSKPEFTPNPVGQLETGFYAVEIIPTGGSHLKNLNLGGISRPMSASNNWLGPEIDDVAFHSKNYLIEILEGRDDELALTVKSALRGCRQSFYCLGDESRFLNLVFTLDGLTHAGGWTGWKQRTYIAAVVSGGQIDYFARVLKRYEELYDVRNALVHKGKDFYEMGLSPAQSCEDLYDHVRTVIELISGNNFTSVAELHDYAKSLLRQSNWQARYQAELTAIGQAKGQTPQQIVSKMPAW